MNHLHRCVYCRRPTVAITRSDEGCRVQCEHCRHIWRTGDNTIAHKTAERIESQYVVQELNRPLTRQFAFGQAICGEVSASCENGVLTLRLPKSEVVKRKDIGITSR